MSAVWEAPRKSRQHQHASSGGRTPQPSQKRGFQVGWGPGVAALTFQGRAVPRSASPGRSALTSPGGVQPAGCGVTRATLPPPRVSARISTTFPQPKGPPELLGPGSKPPSSHCPAPSELQEPRKSGPVVLHTVPL